MAKTYDFLITVRRAEFNRGMVSVPYGNEGYIYVEKAIEATLTDAIQKQKEFSEAHKDKAHAAFLSMRYRDDRVAPGLKTKAPTIYNEV